MSPGWIATCALAIVGGYFYSLRTAWLVHLEPAWLPYGAHFAGAAIGGAAMARLRPMRSLVEPLLGGIVAVGVLAVVAFALPKGFNWVAVRSSTPLLVAAIIAISSGAAASGAAWLVRSPTAAGLGSIVLVAATTTGCTVMLGGMIATGFGIHADVELAVTVTTVGAFIAAFATQAIVAAKRIGACSAGIPIVVVWQLIEWVAKSQHGVDPTMIWMVIPFVAAIGGAGAADRAKPRPVEPPLAAFD